MQDPKIRRLCPIAQLCLAVSSQLSHISTVGKKLVKQQYLLHMSSQYGKRWPTKNGWDWFTSFGHPSTFQWVSRFGSATARHCSNGFQPNFAVLKRGRHLCLAGRPSRGALAHIIVVYCPHWLFLFYTSIFFYDFIILRKQSDEYLVQGIIRFQWCVC